MSEIKDIKTKIEPMDWTKKYLILLILENLKIIGINENILNSNLNHTRIKLDADISRIGLSIIIEINNQFTKKVMLKRNIVYVWGMGPIALFSLLFI